MRDLVFSNSFFDKEKRRSFIVGEPMKRSWAADLKILEDVKGVCEKYSLNIFACYGTLLGAIRDHGFIAWDDDIDLGLVGKDYEIFLDIFEKECGEKYNILNPYTRSWHHMNFTHISNGKEMNFSREYMKKWYGCPFMAGPDIFPYYYIPRNPEDEKFILHMLGKIDNTLALFKQSNEMAAQKGELKSDDSIIQALTYNLYELQSATGYEFKNERPLDNQLEILYDQVCRITEESEADYVCRYDEYTANKTKKFPKEYFTSIISVPFENTTMPVPIGYDEVLTKRFGWEYIIPKREAAAHDYPFFKKQLLEDIYSADIHLDTLCNYSKLDQKLFNEKGGQKLLLYHTSVRHMLIYSERVIDTIKKMFDDYAENKSVKMVWFPDLFPQTDDMALDLMAPNLIKEYEQLIKEYVSNGGLIIGREDFDSQMIDKFDEYYGDDDNIAEMFSAANKKVLIQDYSNTIFTKTNDDKTLEKTEIDIPENWRKKIYKSDGSRKKVILYLLSVSCIFQNKEKVLDKVQKALDIFKVNKDEVCLICYIANNNSSNDEITNKIKSEDWIIYMEDDSVKKATDIADAFYGDPDAISLQMKDMHKPVMIQNYDIL